MDQLEIFKALSNKTRLQILTWLKSPELYFPELRSDSEATNIGVCVGLIHKKSGLTQSTISAYLAMLQRAGLVTATRSGQWTYYARNEKLIRSLGEQIASEL